MRSTSGQPCTSCPDDQTSNDGRTHCICPTGTYNSSQWRYSILQCVQHDLQHEAAPAEFTCVSCQHESSMCIASCDIDGIQLREGWALTDSEQQLPNIFRCPMPDACINTDNELCATGFTGALCALCDVGYGMTGNECQLCVEGLKTSRLVVVTVAGLILLFAGLAFIRRNCQRSKTQIVSDKAAPLLTTTENPLALDTDGAHQPGSKVAGSQHGIKDEVLLMFRTAYQPARILVGYGQVVTQIGPVLHFSFPPGIQAVFRALHPLAIDLESIFQIDCVLATSFYKLWMLRVFGLPAIMIFFVAMRFAFEKYVSGNREAAPSNAKSNLFVVVFLVYPSVCNKVFSIFNCRQLDTERVLTSDYSLTCDTMMHKGFQMVAACVALFFCLGVPVSLCLLMARRIREYSTNSSEKDRFVARRVADDIGLDDNEAADAIRDVSTGREYSFLVNAYKPRHFFWEGKTKLLYCSDVQRFSKQKRLHDSYLFYYVSS